MSPGPRATTGRSRVLLLFVLGLAVIWLTVGVERPWVWAVTAPIAVGVGFLWVRVLVIHAGQVIDNMPLGPRPGDPGADDARRPGSVDSSGRAGLPDGRRR